ncbi:MAG TPA: gamma-glutamyl-gamma-aminobutyrate hydrolase family protein [Candidatus Acidoferrales bacterium]|nr:gamma-glutamyl-gamma-aminobutyrate hydrolase family protein [Candidatus Acidoferrales bacterium]
MPASDSSLGNPAQRPRVGIPYRTHKEEVSGVREKYEKYVRAVENAGGTAVEVSLGLASPELEKLARGLDAIVLPGSPADVNPARYGAAVHPKTAEADQARETTDLALLSHCFAEGKPVLAICYGVQILNVYLGGSLIQDIASEVPASITHAWEGRERGVPEPFHDVMIEPESKIATAASKMEANVNSSHHQAIRQPARNLRVVARASDGIIEAVEWIDDANWIVGVQWHPERMAGDAFAAELFRGLIAAARRSAVRA